MRVCVCVCVTEIEREGLFTFRVTRERERLSFRVTHQRRVVRLMVCVRAHP